jgi:hypothetical protein
VASTEDDVVVRLRLKDVKQFIADVKSGKLAIDDLEKKIQKTGRTAARESGSSGGLGILHKTLGGIAIVGRTAMVGLAASAVTASVGLTKAFMGASDLNETVSKVHQVFGRAAASVLAFSKTSATALGQSRNEALTAAANYGNFFRNLGLTERAAAGMSTQLVKTASDLASFNNASPQEMLEGISSALAGEYDPLQRYGMAINAAQVQHEAFRMGLAKTAKDMTPAIQAQAAYALILRQTGKAQGDFIRTRDGFANTSRVIVASLKDMAAEAGKLVLPAVNRAAIGIRDTALPAVQRAVQLAPTLAGNVTSGRANFAAYNIGAILGTHKFDPAIEKGVRVVHNLGVIVKDVLVPALKDFSVILAPVVVLLEHLDSITGFVADHSTAFHVALDLVVGSLLVYKGIMIAMGAAGGVLAAYDAVMDISKIKTLAFRDATNAQRGAIVAWKLAVVGGDGSAVAVERAMDANPVGLVILAIAGIGTALYLAYENIKPFRDYVNGLWADMKGFAEWIQGVWNVTVGNMGARSSGTVTGRKCRRPPQGPRPARLSRSGG